MKSYYYKLICDFLAGSFAVNQLRNTCLTSDGSVVLVGASYSLPGTSILEPSLGDAERSTVESSDKSMERPAGERECLEAQWLCEHYQRHCSVKFPCCTHFYSCHHCHNISTTCDNEEAKACHATHLKCSYCQHEQEVSFYSHFLLHELMDRRHKKTCVWFSRLYSFILAQNGPWKNCLLWITILLHLF